MILSGRKIEELVASGDISITPFKTGQANPNSYNLHLDPHLLRVVDHELSMDQPTRCEELLIPEEGLWLEPGQLYLGRTVERTTAKTVVPMIEGRSSVGRLGMFIHVTAGFGDVGFDGSWTLEILVTKRLKVFPGVPVCQIFFHAIEGEYDLYDSTKYQGQVHPTPSRLWREFKRPVEAPMRSFIIETFRDLVTRYDSIMPSSRADNDEWYVNGVVSFSLMRDRGVSYDREVCVPMTGDISRIERAVDEAGITSFPRCCDVISVKLYPGIQYGKSAPGEIQGVPIYSRESEICYVENESQLDLFNDDAKVLRVIEVANHISKGRPRCYGRMYLLRTKCGKHLIGAPERGGEGWEYKTKPDADSLEPLPKEYEVEYFVDLD